MSLVSIKSFVSVLLFLTQFDWGHGFCQIYEQKSTVGVEQEYLDDYEEVTCCEMVYPTLYHYIECVNSSLITGHQLEVDQTENELKYIKFEFSKIPLVPVGVFTAFTTISQLFLNNSFVANIHPGAFTGLINLEDLYLQDNNIRKISRGTLNSLKNLKLLDLSNNNLEVIEEHALLGLSSLEQVTLNENKLKILAEETFHNINNLKKIDLSYNHLIEISPKLFLNLIKLDQLDLSYNNLTHFDFFFLSNSLQKLDLTSNQINSLENWSDMLKLQEINLSMNRLTKIQTLNANLRYLNLSFNRIVEFSVPIPNNTLELSTLDLSGNVISNLSQDSFRFPNLKNLLLQNNLLVNIPVGGFKNLNSLSFLNLSQNQIVEFEFGTFSGLQALVTLDVSHNKLNYLHESSLHTLKNLKYLNINDNFITSLDPFDLLQHVTLLENISINNNPWNCKALLNNLKIFERMNVSVSQGPTHNSENIQGIPCTNFNKKSLLGSNLPNETIILLLRNVSQELTELHNSFKKILENSNLFLKSFQDDFKNSTFYQFLAQNISEGFDLIKLSEDFKLIHNLNTDFQNSGLYEFSKSFSDLLRNSSKVDEAFQFLKHLNNSKPLNSTEKLNITEELKSLHNYFKNTTFYNLFENNTLFGNSNPLEELKSAYLSDNAFDNVKDVLSKISELQNVIIIDKKVMVVMVVILFIIMVLLIYNNVKPYFRSRNRKNISLSNESGKSNDAVELI